MAGKPNDAHVMAEIDAAELRADPELARAGEHFFLELDVPERAAELVPALRQTVEILAARELYRFERELRGRSADNDRKVVGGQAAVPSFSSSPR